MNQVIEFIKSDRLKEKPDLESLGFGKHFTDHMFILDYNKVQGWHSPRIVPFEPLVLSPSAMVFHYGQAIFEGLKAYKTNDGRTLLFRPDKNIERLNRSCERMCIPPIDPDLVLEAIVRLVEVERDWIPNKEGTSLYIRPFIIATEPYLGVRPASEYKFMIILSPVGAYYSGRQLVPVKIYVEDEYVRAVPGGVGHVKTSGNYAASLYAQKKAEELGYDQVLWLDGKENKYVEEVGSMNIFFKINGEVYTPKLNGSILSGITRDSVIQLVKDWGVPVHEERIAIEDIFNAYKNGELEEVFGTGTAAVISPVGELKWNEHKMLLNNSETGEFSKKLYETITNIQYGKAEDKFGWTKEV
ncbi:MULTISPECIES: branched-chain amino acid aminotransferase [Aeribacillus]|jgi:branched-chain amino acid aminotransferase|uniref:branched-chain amino acid aminotransferase n=1 Tax=Aeribacillus TaxID=1055323 RepID=UPI000E3511CC|nr:MULTISPECIES: branched-chain amino acid aminotransferase [Aeribacillus]MED1437103.1 branched-chain amino acid aminotransferase [Aeribacillus composti]REJ25967.1 MAG: branched chain amino acid aminotransferase [Bacillaceae bacterium]RZI50012.1 branched-chain amino acid aminotransferase [Aeribacillus pallidus]